jgi:hypothetical protein
MRASAERVMKMMLMLSRGDIKLKGVGEMDEWVVVVAHGEGL